MRVATSSIAINEKTNKFYHNLPISPIVKHIFLPIIHIYNAFLTHDLDSNP